jgi:hypothetical protein
MARQEKLQGNGGFSGSGISLYQVEAFTYEAATQNLIEAGDACGNSRAINGGWRHEATAFES